MSDRHDASRDNAKCVVLVPTISHIEPLCEDGLRTLHARGYKVWRVSGVSQIDLGRSQIATDALKAGFEELMWIDSDIQFRPDDVDRIRSHRLPIVCGIYVKKGPRELSCRFCEERPRIKFGKHGGLLEIRYAAAGFLLTHRQVYLDIQAHDKLPVCNEQFQRPVVPYFHPLVEPIGDSFWYLGEDFSFCERARRSQYKIMADTTIRLGHLGSYAYHWEDIGRPRELYENYSFTPEEDESSSGHSSSKPT